MFTFGLCYQCGYHHDLRIDRPFSAAKDYGKPSLFRARSVLPTLNERPPLSDIQARVQQQLGEKIRKFVEVEMFWSVQDCQAIVGGISHFYVILDLFKMTFFTLYHDKFWEIYFFTFSKHFMQIQVIDLFSVWMMPFKYNDV